MKIKLFAFTFLLSFFSINAQVLPEYPERGVLQLKDPSFLDQYLSFSSEGALNPDEYKVGPGDLIFISISGLDEKNFSVSIDPEGFLYIPRIGVLDLRNKTLSETKSIIKEKLLKNFKDVDIHISLQNHRKIKVALIGNVRSPSTYVLSSSSRLLDLFVLSSGVNENSDIRNITVISKDGNQKKIDLLKFLRLGDYSQNPYLNDGDVIQIEKSEKVISLYGQIKYVGNYEFKEGETIDEILKIAGGLLFKARKDSIELIRFTEDGKSQFSLFYNFDQIQKEKIKLHHRDIIVVREIPDYYDVEYVQLNGEIKYPGLYKIK
ncbi:MAG: SLBB domain-containing protein, partial [Ignavibacterium sp.]|uniref:SLBB domain-containing protein n=1 Tax=Ignavibacterium sp. TaxID=2651167 RepID=UPI00404A0C35